MAAGSAPEHSGHRVMLIWHGGYGSGFLVGPRVVLTSGHVVDPAKSDGRTLVEPVAARGAYECTVVWRREDDAVDAALLHITDPAWTEPSGLEPVRFGTLTGPDLAQACSTVGFPDAAALSTGRRDTHQLNGVINPGAAQRANRHRVQISGTAPADLGASPWSGLSGGALFCGDLLTGLLDQDPGRPWRHGHLDAVPVRVVLGDEGFQAAWLEHVGEAPRVESVELATSGLFEPPVRRRPLSPASLLNPELEVLPFQGRAEELGELGSWCTADDPATVSMRLVVGPGGQGKTRLALELAARLRDRGWITGRLARRTPDHAAYGVLACTEASPTLLVVDYAESRVNDALDLLNALTHRVTGPPIRVLLLARSAGAWWTRLRRSSPWVDDFIAASEPLTLPVLHDDPAASHDAYVHAVAAFAPRLAALPDYAHIDWNAAARLARMPSDLASAGANSALRMEMAALASLLQSGLEPVAAAAPRNHLEDVLLGHEQRYWEAAARARRPQLPHSDDTLRRAVTVACLVQPADRAEAEGVARAVPGLRDVSEDPLLSTVDWLRGLYPSSGTEYWAALQPDPLADHLIVEVLGEEPDLLGRLLPVLPEAQLPSAFAVLGRVWAQSPRVAEIAAQAVVAYPEQLGAAAVGSVTALADPRPMVDAIERILGSQPSVSVAFGMLTAMPERTELLAETSLRVALGICVPMLQHSSSEPGSLPIAIHAACTVVHRLVQTDSDPEIAQALGAQCVELATALVEDQGTEHRGLLIRALHLHAIASLQCGKPSAANEELERAFDLVDQVGRHSGAVDPTVLAGLLNSHAHALSSLNRHNEAVAAFEEALRVLEPVAREPQMRWTALGVELAYAAHLGPSGRHPEAYDRLARLIPQLEQLAEINPDTYRTQLVGSLVQTALTLVSLERYPEARAILDRLRTMPREERGTRQRELVLDPALTMLAHLEIRESGYTAEAIQIKREIVELYRPIKDARLGRGVDFQVIRFGDALLAHADFLAVAELRDQALAAANEAAEAFTGISDAAADKRVYGLARARVLAARQRSFVNNAADVVSSMDDTIAALREAVSAGSIDPTDPVLSAALTIRGNRRFVLGDPTAAVDDLEEAVRLRRERILVEPTEDRRRGELAATLSDLGSLRKATGNLPAALAAVDGALEIRRRLAAEDPGSHLTSLGQYTANKADVLVQMGLGHRADTLIRNVLRDLEQQVRQDRHSAAGPAVYLSAIRARLLVKSGDFAQAERIATRVVSRYRELSLARIPVPRSGYYYAQLVRGHCMLKTAKHEAGVELVDQHAAAVLDLGDPGLHDYLRDILRLVGP